MENLSMDQVILIASEYLLPIVWSIVILILGRIVAKILSKNIAKVLYKTKLDVTIVKFIQNLSFAALFAFVILAALEKVGVKTTTFAAVVAAAGLAIGFALQSSLSNFASGFMLLLFKPFKVGDYVQAGGVEGSVHEIQLFTTKMKTPDNKVVIVPNGQITGDSITNFSAEETRRIDLVIGVGYGDDLSKVKTVLNDIVAADTRIHKEPAVTIAVSELADSSVNLVVRPWVNTVDYWAVRFDLIETIKNRFDAEGISIPFPQRDLHVFNEKNA